MIDKPIIDNTKKVNVSNGKVNIIPFILNSITA